MTLGINNLPPHSGLISVIVTTYNWPSALGACLNSLLAQNDAHFEIIVADDGSGPDTQTLVGNFQQLSPIPIRHVHHEDQGFRAGTIRNKAAAVSQGSYLLFVDGDCIALPNFISRHRALAEPGYFVPGNRILLSQNYTHQTLASSTNLHARPLIFFLGLWLQRRINRLLPLLYWPSNIWRYRHPKMWQKAMTCNLAVWKTDFAAVNGFDEDYQGWGYEDSDLIIRMIHNGTMRKEGRFAVPVLHLWHPHNDRSRHDNNYQRLIQRLADESLIRIQRGVGQYLANDF